MKEFQLGSVPHRSRRASILSFQGIWPQLANSVFLADGARVIGDVVLGENCSVWFNAVVRGDVHSIRIGSETNVQDGAIIHCTYKRHKTEIGSRVSIAHLAMLHGCVVEDNCLIGMQSIVMDGAVIGEGSIVAAGAVVSPGTKVPPGSLVLGTPAKVMRPLRDDEREGMLATTQRYIEYCKGYDFRIDANNE